MRVAVDRLGRRIALVQEERIEDIHTFQRATRDEPTKEGDVIAGDVIIANPAIADVPFGKQVLFIEFPVRRKNRDSGGRAHIIVDEPTQYIPALRRSLS